MAAAKISERVKGELFTDWWSQRVEYAKDAETRIVDLTNDYYRWVGRAKAYGPQAFSRALQLRGVHAKKLPAGPWVRVGIRLKTAAEAKPVVVRPEPETASVVYHKVEPSEATPFGVGMVNDYRISPFIGGETRVHVMLDTDTDAARMAARIAGELYVERRRQGEVKGYTHADDDALAPGELASMAAAFAFAAGVPPKWSGWLTLRRSAPDAREPEGYPVLGMLRVLWRRSLETFSAASPRGMLVKAGGLIIAAIETIDRAEARKVQEQGGG